MGVVFAKTRKGQEEMETRSGTLTPRVRRVLIMVDGKRTVDDLRGMLQHDDLQHTLGLLEEDGFIVMAEATTTMPAGGVRQPLPTTPPANLTAFRPLPAEHDAVEFQMARNFMLNTLNAFVGSLGATSLIERIDACRTHAQLRALFDEWYHAIIMSREGRREAETLRTKLFKVL